MAAREWLREDAQPCHAALRFAGNCVILDAVEEKSSLSVRYLLAIAGLGGLLYGVDFGVIAAAEPYMKAMGVLSDAHISHIVGAVLLGGIVATLTAGVLAERFGRKRMISVSAAMFLAAIPVVSLSPGVFHVLYAGRMLQGMSAGYMAVVMPMYLTETLPPGIRGRGTGVFQFCLGLGLVVAAGAGCLVATVFGAADTADAAGKVAAWGANFWWTMVPVAALFAGSLRLPESPVWLAARRDGGALAAREDTRLSGAACGAAGWRGLLRRRYVVPFLLACLVLTFNKTTGMSSFTSYLVTILNGAGFEGILANWGQLAVKLTNMLVTIAAAALVDRKGRTWLLKVGTAGMTAGLAAIGCVFLAIERFGVEANNVTGLLAMCAFFVMQTFYALGPGLCVWLVLSELMPLRIRANGMAVALFMNQLVAWGLASWFRPWVAAWGWSSMFFFFAANGALYFVTTLFIPETKGMSLEELEHLFEKKERKAK
ncbi:MAG: MFS transporter [Kiritimatiellae bacterium]|nr:MFS transporter [Kiritimatiellia bacterium]